MAGATAIRVSLMEWVKSGKDCHRLLCFLLPRGPATGRMRTACTVPLRAYVSDRVKMEEVPSDPDFRATRWSLVERARGADPALRREALGSLFALYWPALRAHLV